MSSQRPRPYQVELLDAALEENTIVNLGTGAGKTYIAVMLIKELSADIVLQGKKSVFLVTTVPLVKQQADYISLHTRLQVGRYTGDMNVDSWPDARWQIELEQYQVFVMTMTIFKNLILQKHLTFSQVNLLIFDECHHAVKNHDYVQIMKRFSDDRARREGSMRLLGLTASLIPSKCKPGDLEWKIKELEKTLCCRTQTAADLREVARYATNPVEVELCYKAGECDPDVRLLKNMLNEPLDFLASFTKSMRTVEFYETVKVNLEDCLHILLNLGIWCAHEFAIKGQQDIDNQIRECNGIFTSKWDETLLHLGSTHLRVFVQESAVALTRAGLGNQTVDKVKKLFLHLGDSAICSGEIALQDDASDSKKAVNKLVGIIFTERRTTATFLAKLLQQQSRMVPDLAHVKCDYIVGHDAKAGITHLRRESKMNTKKQEEVLMKFRTGKLNLLVSTSVLEEGVDVPKCNSVIRFDFPQNFRSYIQSKGRARARESKYVLLIPEEDYGKLKLDLSMYNALVRELERVCHDRHVEDDYQHLAEMVPPYKNAHGAVATIHSSLSLVHRYCQTLPKDRYTVLAPNFSTEKRRADVRSDSPFRVSGQELEFQSALTFPMSSPLRDPIKGMWFPTKRLADKSAALEAVKRLDREGELDHHLKPVTRALDSEGEEEEGEGEEINSRDSGVDTEGKNRYYRNKVAPALGGCFPTSDHENRLYIFYISDTSGGLYLSQPLEVEVQLSFGILSSKTLPHLQIPDYSIYVDDKELHVKICEYHLPVPLQEKDLELLTASHKALFQQVLKIRHSWLKYVFGDAEKNYLVVPLCFFPFMQPMEAFIDLESARLLASLEPTIPSEASVQSETHLTPVQWPEDRERLRNAIVVRKYNTSPLYEVQEVLGDVTVSSACSIKGFSTYKEYLNEKYGCTFTDDAQPALKCKALGESGARLQLLRSRYKTVGGADMRKSDNRTKRAIELFPEVCCFYPLPANLWRLAYCIPSILWRIECVLSVDQLRTKISTETGIGRISDNTEVVTHIDFRGYKDVGFGNLASQKFTTNLLGESERVTSSYDPLKPPLRGPDNVLLLQALTTKSASDSIDLERLETLGDSFLKLSTTVYLYCDRTDAHEGRLSLARSRRVCNQNLYKLARRQGIADVIFSTTFDPKQMWTPPCCVFDKEDPSLKTSPESRMSVQERHYLYHKLTPKGVADCVESLTGAYLVSGGILAGLKFMTWTGIKIRKDNSDWLSSGLDGMMARGEELEEGELASMSSQGSSDSYAMAPRAKQRRFNDEWQPPIFVKNSSSILTRFFGSPCSNRQLDPGQQTELDRLLSRSFSRRDAREILGWVFTDRTLLLQSVTHASYTKNRITDCYQRLEFMGDAVLDYLVTCHIYSTFHNYGPGDITNMRSALVNNRTFAEFAVELGLHKYLLYNSPSLYKQIEQYLRSEGVYSKEEGDSSSPEMNATLSEDHLTTEETSSNEGEEGEGEDEEEEIEDWDPPKVLGDLLESIAGAIFVDSGMSLEAVWTIFKPHFEGKIASFKGNIPVSHVQEMYHREQEANVQFKSEGARRVKCTITVPRKGNPLCCTAVAGTRKAAKAAAAKGILAKLDKETS